MRDRVRLLQMTLHWHMTGERHFKFLTGRDISPDADRQHGAELVGPPSLTQSHATVRPVREPRRGGEGGSGR